MVQGGAWRHCPSPWDYMLFFCMFIDAPIYHNKPTRLASPATTHTRLLMSSSSEPEPASSSALQSEEQEPDEEEEEEEEEYGVIARLREEAESPFRPLRFFVYGGMAASGAIGALISFTGALAAYSGRDGTEERTDPPDDQTLSLSLCITTAPYLFLYTHTRVHPPQKHKQPQACAAPPRSASRGRTWPSTSGPSWPPRSSGGWTRRARRAS